MAATLFVFLLLTSYLCDASFTSNIERPCPDDIIIFTCNVSGLDLIWQVLSSEGVPVAQFNIDDRTMVNTPEEMMGFTATLCSRTSNTTSSSTLTTTASAQINGYTVVCGDAAIEIGHKTVQLSDPPSTPVIIDIPSSQQRFAESVIVSIEWNVNNGGADIHNYTVSVSPSTQLSATLVTSTNVTVAAEYNVNYTLNIVATNCAGNSDPAVYMFSVSGCPSLTAPSDGVLDPDTNRTLGPGAIVTYLCNQGFMPAGPMTIMCLDNLMWDPNPITLVCDPVTTIAPPNTCGSPQPPSNGSVNFGNQSPPYVQGTTVTVQCDDGLFPIDAMNTTCMDMSRRGEWDPNPANLICRKKPINCSVPDEPVNGTILDHDNIVTTEGSVITFQCNPGLSPEGNRTAICTNAGIWSPDPAGMMCMNIKPTSGPIANQYPAIVGGILAMAIGSIIMIVVIISILVRRNKKLNPQAMEMHLTGNLESEDALHPAPPGEYSELRHSGPKKGSIMNNPPPPDSEGYNRITRDTDRVPLAYDDVVLDSTVTVEISHDEYSTLSNSAQKSQPQPGYSQLGTGRIAVVEPVIYADVGKHLKKPAVECYVDQHSVNYATVDIKATKKRAASKPPPSKTKCAVGPTKTADDLLNLDQVLIQLRPVHSKWKEIAQALRVPVTFIEQLEEAFSMDASSRMTEITDHWMRECSGKPTWRELADALKTIGEVQLAQQFMQIYETGHLPVELDMNEVPKDIYKHDNAPPPPLPKRGPGDSLSHGASNIPPPRPNKLGTNLPPAVPPKTAPHGEPKKLPPRPPKPHK